ncbi:MAG: hypothetical protein JNL42_13500 [Anaerolineae bacterium]|nr:hypothetical protein [Anaerolineae bacterium]
MMKARFVLAFSIIALAWLMLIGAAPAVLFAQNDPTQVQQTNAAAVQMLFDQTAAAIPTRTAEAQLAQAQTVTAAAQMAPTQTIQAQFNAALTATAIGDVPDYSQYQVIGMQEFDLLAAPGQTSAHLSPDGDSFAHFEGSQMCLYRQREASYSQDRCFDLEPHNFRGPTEELYWSPDGRYLSIGTFDEGLRFLRDTDIRVIDTQSGTLINLTDDAFDGGLLDEFAGNFDLAPHWLDADTLAFIRYTNSAAQDSNAGLIGQFSLPAIYTVDLPSEGVLSELELRFVFPAKASLSVYVLTVDPRDERLAFVYDTRNSETVQGVWSARLDGGDLKALHLIPTLPMLPIQLDYAANGRYLLTFVQGARSGGLTMRVISSETGDEIEIDPRFPTTSPDGSQAPSNAPMVVGAGWSPRGSALAYLVRDPVNADGSGLYITNAPGIPGKMVLSGEFYGTTCCQRMPIRWAANDTIMIGRGPERGVLLVQVGG